MTTIKIRSSLLGPSIAVQARLAGLDKAEWDESKHPRGPGGKFASGPQYLSPQDFKVLKAKAAAHIAAAPKPSRQRAAENRRAIALANRTGGRAGGDFRGSSKDRAASRAWLLRTFGDGETVGCVHCGQVLTDDTLTRDKIYTGDQGGRYDHANIIPSCSFCNQTRSDTPIGRTKIGGA